MKNLLLLPILLIIINFSGISQKALYHKLDSLIETSNDFGPWVTQNKLEYEYDSSGRMMLSNHYSKDPTTNDIVPNYQMQYTYDHLNRFSELFNYDWNNDSSDYILSEKFVYSYGTNQLVDTIVGYNWNPNNSIWFEVSQKTYTYDQSDLLILNLTLGMDIINQVWKNSKKIESVYNSNKKLERKSTLSWDSNSWDSTRKEINTYTSNNLIDTTTFFNKDASTNSLKPYLKRGFLYDTQDRIVDQTDVWWNNAQSFWYIFDRMTYQYNNDNDISEIMRYQGDFTVPWIRRIPTYNSQIPESELKLPPNYSFNKMKTGTDGHMFWLSDSSWHSNYTETLYYSDLYVSIKDLEISNEVTVYPNPASNFITFKTENHTGNLSLLIMSINGAIVVNKQITPGQMVSLNPLTNGQYVYQLFDGKKHYTGTFIKN
jgi:hypothetical protein